MATSRPKRPCVAEPGEMKMSRPVRESLRKHSIVSKYLGVGKDEG